MKTLLLIAALLAPVLVAPQVRTGVVTGQLRSANGQPVAGIRISAMVVPEPGIPPSSASIRTSALCLNGWVCRSFADINRSPTFRTHF